MMNHTVLTPEGKVVTLSAKELSLIEELRKVGWGEVTVFMADNEPQRIECIREGKKL